MNLSRRTLLPAAVLAGLLGLPAPASADQIAYTCAGDNDLCVVDPDSGSPTNLTNTPLAVEKQPYWSPDGTKLAYYGQYPGSISDVYTLDVASPGVASNVSQTPDSYEGFYPIAWSPSGARIAFTSDPAASPSPLDDEILVGSPDGTLTPFSVGSSPSAEAHPDYSPDGTKIAFARGQAVYTASAGGGDSGTAQQNGYQPDWSPDGTRIATVTGDAIRIARVDGTGTPVTVGSDLNGFVIDGPFFSPDSSRVMWAKQQLIYIARADGTGSITTITPPNGRPLNRPSWSPDGTRIAFSGADATHSNFDIFVANADGTGSPRSVASTPTDDFDPVWKPDPDAQPQPDPEAQPPVGPPVDPPAPPGTQPRPPVTISLAQFRKPEWTGTNPPFVLISFVSCPNDYPTSNPRCQWRYNGTIKTKVSTPGRPRLLAAKPKKKTLKLPGVPVDLAPGESGELRLQVPKKAQKALKPGKTYKLRVSVEQTTGSDPVVKTTKTLQLKVPKKKGK
jgi:Tol biopolymer transport system component